MPKAKITLNFNSKSCVVTLRGAETWVKPPDIDGAKTIIVNADDGAIRHFSLTDKKATIVQFQIPGKSLENVESELYISVKQLTAEERRRGDVINVSFEVAVSPEGACTIRTASDSEQDLTGTNNYTLQIKHNELIP